MSTKLERSMQISRRIFQPNDSKDLIVVKEFFKNNTWGLNGCPFYLEWPYLNIPDMLKDKITKFSLKI